MINKIAKDWRVKVVTQKLIGILPSFIAMPINEILISAFSRKITERYNVVDRANKCLNNLNMVYEHTGYSVENASIIEVGTGWYGIDLMIFNMLGAQKIITIDHWKHLEKKNFEMFLVELLNNIDQLNFGNFKNIDQYYLRLSSLKQSCCSESSLEKLFKRINIRYLKRKSCLPIDIDINNNSIDFIYSESTLQRIPELDMQELIKLLVKYLKNEGIMFARTDQKDIHAQKHVDNNLWELQYLKYSDWIYRLTSSKKLNYQNRFRESDFIKTFEENGVEILYKKSTLREENIKKIMKSKIALRFIKYDANDLAITASILIGKYDANKNV